MQEIKNNPQLYTTEDGIEKVKNNPQVYTTQKGMQEIKKPSGIQYPRGNRSD